MPIYVVEYGRGIITPLKVDPRIKQVEELQAISALHPLGITDHGIREHNPPAYEQPSEHPSQNQKSEQSGANKLSATKTAKEFMSSPVLFGSDAWTVTEALEYLKEHKIRYLPVSDGKEVIGLFSESDLLHAAIANSKTQLSSMSGPFIVVSGENSLERVALAMLYKNTDVVLVRSGEFKVVGIITSADFLKVFAEISLEAWA